MSTPSLHINHWHIDCVVARGHPAPERARSDLDQLFARLPDELAAGLAPWFDSEDGVVLIKDLDFECELDLADASDATFARWMQRFSRALVEAIHSGDHMRFANVAAYRAQFIADLACGHAWRAWYYRGFAGLQALPTAAGIRTVLLEDSTLGRSILAALPARAWPALATMLPECEALRIIEGLATTSDDAILDPCRLRALSAQAADLVPQQAPGFLRALAIMHAALRADVPATQDLAAWALLAGEVIDLASGAQRNGLVRALLDGNTAALAVAGVEAQRSRDALAAHPEWRAPLADLLDPGSSPAASSRHDGTPAWSDFAGLALLLPEMDGLLDDAVCAALPPLHDPLPRNVAGWLAVAHGAGAPRTLRLLREGFWRDFFAVAPQFGIDDLRAWLEEVDAAPAMACLARHAQTLARGTDTHALLAGKGTRAWLRVDQATGVWCEWTSTAEHARPSGPVGFAATRDARRDWNYLHTDLGLPEPWQRFFIQLAQVALRRFAYRIPGFAGTSLDHLHANFLGAAGQHAGDGCLRLVRPPLHALLNLTGISRSHLQWSGPPARTLMQEYAP